MTKYYKFIDVNNTGGISEIPWHLPKGRRPGKWMPKIDKLILCKSGYHIVMTKDLFRWFHLGERLFEIEVKGEVRGKYWHKCLAHEARIVKQVINWNKKSRRLYCVDCAMKTLPIFEKKYPLNTIPRQAIITSQRFALGRATVDELKAANIAVQKFVFDPEWFFANMKVGNAAIAAECASDEFPISIDGDEDWQRNRFIEYLNGTAKLHLLQQM